MLIHGRFDNGFGWMAEPSHYMQRSSTALAVDGKVWLIDPEKAPGIDAEIEALGKPVAIVSAVGWHDRDVDWFAAKYGIPVYGGQWLRNQLYRTPLVRVERDIPDSPLQLLNTSMRGAFGWWTESAVWWAFERVLVTADCLGTAVYFAPEHEKLGVHPVVRLSPPHTLAGLAPRRIYCGHGASVQEGAAEALQRALAVAPSNRPKALVSALGRLWRRSRA